MVVAVLFDFNRQGCKLGPLPSLSPSRTANRGHRGTSSDHMGNDLMGS
jgi:hypothetical protein